MVKQLCDWEYGVPCQCINSKNIANRPPGYFDNFLLKMNGKLEGKNSLVRMENFFNGELKIDGQTMVIGIDVNHPAEAELSKYSVAAAVCSLDVNCYRYAATVRVQKEARLEAVTQIGGMIDELIQEFCLFNRPGPNSKKLNLIIFRDGIDEGQFTKIRNIELGQIKAKAQRLGAKVTMIVVQKRHHTRFVQKLAPKKYEKVQYANVSSGTVVDNGIVDPQYKMFYLKSHPGKLGTAKSSKYVILENEQNWSVDQLQRLCYHLCYNSIRTRNSNAIPTPIRYADLCAHRGKLHLEALHQSGVPIDHLINDQQAFTHFFMAKPQVKRNLYFC